MLKILIADDHSIVRKGIKQIISDVFRNTIVDEAEDTRSLYRKVTISDWDLVISDLNMPGGSMFNLIRELKLKKPGLPIIIFSSQPDEQYAEQLLKLGVSAYVNKYEPDKLVQEIRKLLPGREILSE